MIEQEDYSGWHVTKCCASVAAFLLAAAGVWKADLAAAYVDDDGGPEGSADCHRGYAFDPWGVPHCRTLDAAALGAVGLVALTVVWMMLSLVGLFAGWGYDAPTRHFFPPRWSVL